MMSSKSIAGSQIAAFALVFSLAAAPALADVSAAPGVAATEPQPAATLVAGLDATLLDVMQNARQLGYKGRYDKLHPALTRTFDIPLMTEVAVGAGWHTLSPEQQQSLTDALGQYITATYASRFDGYSGEKFVEAGTRPLGSGVLVQTKLVKSDGSPVALSYYVRESADGPRVIDVFLTGTISEMATRRSEFASVYKTGGYDGLLHSLQQKVADLSTSSKVG